MYLSVDLALARSRKETGLAGQMMQSRTVFFMQHYYGTVYDKVELIYINLT